MERWQDPPDPVGHEDDPRPAEPPAAKKGPQQRFLEAITGDISPEDILRYVGLPPSKFFRMIRGKRLREKLAMRQVVIDAKVEHRKTEAADTFMEYLLRMATSQDGETVRRILMDVLRHGDEIKAPSGNIDRAGGGQGPAGSAARGAPTRCEARRPARRAGAGPRRGDLAPPCRRREGARRGVRPAAKPREYRTPKRTAGRPRDLRCDLVLLNAESATRTPQQRSAFPLPPSPSARARGRGFR